MVCSQAAATFSVLPIDNYFYEEIVLHCTFCWDMLAIPVGGQKLFEICAVLHATEGSKSSGQARHKSRRPDFYD